MHQLSLSIKYRFMFPIFQFSVWTLVFIGSFHSEGYYNHKIMSAHSCTRKYSMSDHELKIALTNRTWMHVSFYSLDESTDMTLRVVSLEWQLHFYYAPLQFQFFLASTNQCAKRKLWMNVTCCSGHFVLHRLTSDQSRLRPVVNVWVSVMEWSVEWSVSGQRGPWTVNTEDKHSSVDRNIKSVFISVCPYVLLFSISFTSM